MAKKKENGSYIDSSSSSIISPVPFAKSQSIGFVPILNKVDLDTDEVNKTQVSDSAINLNSAELASLQKKADLTVGNINEISAINNTTVQSSVNTSQLDMIRKLHQSELGNKDDSKED